MNLYSVLIYWLGEMLHMYAVFIHGVLSYVLSNGTLNWLICFHVQLMCFGERERERERVVEGNKVCWHKRLSDLIFCL